MRAPTFAGRNSSELQSLEMEATHVCATRDASRRCRGRDVFPAHRRRMPTSSPRTPVDGAQSTGLQIGARTRQSPKNDDFFSGALDGAADALATGGGGL